MSLLQNTYIEFSVWPIVAYIIIFFPVLRNGKQKPCTDSWAVTRHLCHLAGVKWAGTRSYLLVALCDSNTRHSMKGCGHVTFVNVIKEAGYIPGQLTLNLECLCQFRSLLNIFDRSENNKMGYLQTFVSDAGESHSPNHWGEYWFLPSLHKYTRPTISPYIHPSAI